MKLWKKNRKPPTAPSVVQVQTAAPRRSDSPFSALRLYGSDGAQERQLYTALREAIPVIDAAINKLVRLLGDFTVRCDNKAAQTALCSFLGSVPVNGCQTGITAFLNCYFSQLLTYGTAVGEMVLTPMGDTIGALYNADLDDVTFRKGASPLQWVVCRKTEQGDMPVPYPALLLTSALNPPHGNAYGVSLLHGLPFVSNILLKIYHTIGVNWDRVGNVRFAVTYQPTGDPVDRANARDHAQQIADAWSHAMEPGGQVSDFVAVGNVNVKVIGADNQILDSDIPVRQLLEQIVAKLGLPPFLLGFSWSSTERMSSQQADILTSEMDSYRTLITPVIQKICRTWMLLNGYDAPVQIEWGEITLQDAVDLAEARLKNAQAAQIEQSLAKEEVQ
ncbi:MAG: serine/threonine protein phosphatase [Oscillospiraceae bacterium]|nr:serine/threonine protein phosphatase [Oscillospiraceae bacterium]